MYTWQQVNKNNGSLFGVARGLFSEKRAALAWLEVNEHDETEIGSHVFRKDDNLFHLTIILR